MEFLSTLDFTREGAGVIEVSYIRDGYFKTYYNSDMIDILMDD